MATKSSTKGNIFLRMNLLCYVLTAAACGTCTTPSPPLNPPPCGDSSSGSTGISAGSGGSSGSISGGSSGSYGGSGGSSGSISGGNSGGPSRNSGSISGGSGGSSGSISGGSGGTSGGGSGGSGGTGGTGGSGPGHQPANCPRDALKLGVCANILGGSTVGVVVGNPPTTPCCTVLAGLVDLEAAVCLCTAIRANVLGNNLNIPISLSLLLNACGRTPPSGFVCA